MNRLVFRSVALVTIAAAGACSRSPAEPVVAPSEAGAVAQADAAPPPAKEPGWDLDDKDPARDYVEAYVQSTNRYGEDTTCAHATPSKIEKGRTIVEVRGATGNAGKACKGASALRDRFAVDVASDHLELADPSKGKPLASWPDKSDPKGGGPGPDKPQEVDIRGWTSPIKTTLHDLQLVPMRIQYYGHGSYPVITLAGFRPPLAPSAPAADLTDAAKKLCEASNGRPMAFFAGVDRKRLLRVRCPDQTRWETL